MATSYLLGSPVLTYLFYSLLLLVWIFILVVLRDLFAPREKQLRERIRQLEEKLREKEREHREEVEHLRRHYEELLKEAAIKNTVMSALYHAWQRGELRKCYRDGGEVRILADGTVLCELPKKEKSYAIATGVQVDGDQ